MSRLSTPDEDPLVEERLALLALTSEVDLFSHEVAKSRNFLDDADQELLSRFYVAHLMPTASSFWWNDGNAVLAKTRLLGQRYPYLRTKQWRQSASKTRIVLQKWRKDSLRLFPDLTDGLCKGFDRDNDESDEEQEAEDDYIVTANTRSKRKIDEVDAMISKKARTLTTFPPISPGINSPLENQHVSTPARPPHRPQTNLITPPQSGESTPVIVISDDDEDSDDQDPVPMRRRRRRSVSKPLQTPIAAAAYRSPLSFSPAHTVVSLQPAEDPQQIPTCATTSDGEPGFTRNTRDGQIERNKTDREIKKLGKQIRSLTKMVRNLNMEIRA